MENKRLDLSFFNRDTVTVARELLGKYLVFGDYHGLIIETEAYVGKNDPASHAFRGRTKRTEVMFGRAGYSYVYLIYGMYHCLNIVTEEEGVAGGVLIRGVNLLSPKVWCINGPGKLCRDLGITLEHNIHDMITSDSLYVLDNPREVTCEATPRIGISVGTDKLWRFIATDYSVLLSK